MRDIPQTSAPYYTHRIFVSHSSTDNKFTKKLADDLRRVVGDDSAVWYDYKLYGGTSWWRKIVEELTERDVFIVILSPYAFKSKWVNDEIDLAWKQKNSKIGKLIIPLIFRPCKKRRPDLDNLQSISFLSPNTYESAFNELLKALGIKSAAYKDTREFSSDFEISEVKTIQQRMVRIKNAFEKEAWTYVIRETKALVSLYPDAISPSVYQMQGLAYLYQKKMHHAQHVLLKALRITSSPELRLQLLDAYAAPFITFHQWDEVFSCANDALQLAPHDQTWQVARDEALKRKDTISTSNQNSVFETKDAYRADAKAKAAKIKLNQHQLEMQPAPSPGKQLTELATYQTAIELQKQLLELEKQQLEARKIRLAYEKERMTTTFELGDMIAERLCQDAGTQLKALLSQSLLLDLLQFDMSQPLELSPSFFQNRQEGKDEEGK